MNSTATDVLELIVGTITPTQIPVYEGIAPQGAKYPYVVAELVGAIPAYSLGGDSGIRIDSWVVRITFYDNHRAASDQVRELDQMIGQLLEPQFNVVKNQTVIMNADRGTTIGPAWLSHENYWMLSTQWHIRATANGTFPPES